MGSDGNQQIAGENPHGTQIQADEPGEEDVAAYARIDRLLDSLRADDCCLLLGRASPRRRPSSHFPLVSLVDAWLQLALDPSDPCRRQAA